MPPGVWVQVPPSARSRIRGERLADRLDRRETTTLHAVPSALIPWLDPAAIIDWAGPWALAVVCFIVFAETGLLVGFLLPGDTLLAVINELGVSTTVLARTNEVQLVPGQVLAAPRRGKAGGPS